MPHTIEFDDCAQLRDWLRALNVDRALKNGWVDDQGELHVWSEADQVSYVGGGDDSVPDFALVLDAVERTGRDVTEVRVYVPMAEVDLHVHPVERLWSSKALLPKFESVTLIAHRGPWPVTVQGARWLHESGHLIDHVIELDVRDGVLVATLRQVHGCPLSKRTFYASTGTLTEVPLRSWPTELPQWHTPWHIEPSHDDGAFVVGNVTLRFEELSDRDEAASAGTSLPADWAGGVWVSLRENGAGHEDGPAMSVFLVVPTRRKAAGTRGGRPVFRSSSLLVIDADRHAARVWMDRTAMFKAGPPRAVPHSPYVAARHPNGDWFVHGSAAGSVVAQSSAVTPELRLDRLHEATEAATFSTVCGVDYYLDSAEDRSGKVEVAVAVPAGNMHQAATKAARRTLGTLALAAPDVALWTTPIPDGEDQLELSTAALEAAGALLACSYERPLMMVFFVDMRGGETYLACVATVADRDDHPPLVLAQERLQVGLLNWARPWVEQLSCDCDIVQQASSRLSNSEAMDAANAFYLSVAAAVGVFVGSVLASKRAMDMLRQHSSSPAAVDDVSWGPDVLATVVLDGWGFAPLWPKRDGGGLPPTTLRRIREKVLESAKADLEATPGAEAELRVVMPNPHGPRYLLDAYYAGWLPVTKCVAGATYGPVGAAGRGDVSGAVERGALYDGVEIDGGIRRTLGFSWEPTPSLVALGVASTVLSDESARNRLPWAVLAERRIQERMTSETEPLVFRLDERRAAFDRLELDPAFRRYVRLLKTGVRDLPLRELTVEKLLDVGVSSPRHRLGILAILNPESRGEPAVKPRQPANKPAVPPRPAPAPPPAVPSPRGPPQATQTAAHTVALAVGDCGTLESYGLGSDLEFEVKCNRLPNVELEAALVVLHPQGKRFKARTEGDLIYFGARRHESGAIDMDESVNDGVRGTVKARIHLELLPIDTRIAVVIFLYTANGEATSFAGSSGVGFKLRNQPDRSSGACLTGQPDPAFSPDADCIALIEFYRENGRWCFALVASPVVPGGLAGACLSFGVPV